MNRHCIYPLGDATRIVSTQKRQDFAYGIAFDVETPRGNFHIDMDKEGRILEYGAVQVGGIPRGVFSPNDYDTSYTMAWFTDERVVAALAKLVDDNWNRRPGAQWPDEGEEVPMPTEDEAKAILRQLGVPRDPETAKEIRENADMLNLKGEPPWL